MKEGKFVELSQPNLLWLGPVPKIIEAVFLQRKGSIYFPETIISWLILHGQFEIVVSYAVAFGYRSVAFLAKHIYFWRTGMRNFAMLYLL